jgi:hypothetical protein
MPARLILSPKNDFFCVLRLALMTAPFEENANGVFKLHFSAFYTKGLKIREKHPPYKKYR